MKRIRHLRACLSLFKIHLAQGLQYRLAALSGGSISIFWALIELSVYTAFFTYGDNRLNTAGMTLPMTVTYIWLGQALFAIQPMSIDGDILNAIVKGDVGLALCRPLSLYWHWGFQSAGGRLSQMVLRCVPVAAAGLLIPGVWHMSGPATLGGFLFFLLSFCCAFGLASSYAMLMTAIRLNITWGDGPTYMLMLIGGVLSGNYLPLKLWPDWMQTFLYYQPFAGYLDLPARLYLGLIPPAQAFSPIAVQLAWTLVFMLLGQTIMNRKMAALIVQGG